MNAKITASDRGSHLPPDPRSPPFKPPGRPRSNGETPAVPENDRLTTDAPLSRYTVGEAPAANAVANAISLSQTQEGFLRIVQKSLDRMGELSGLCTNANQPAAERAQYTSEFTLLQNFISNIGTKKFNGAALFSAMPLEVSVESGGPKVPLNAIDFNAATSKGGLAGAYDPNSTELQSDGSVVTAVAHISQALENLGTMQAKVDANLHRLSLSVEQLSVLNENLFAANNQIQDIDQVKNITQFARFKMLGQSGAAMMAQANAFPQTALRLLD